MAKVPNGIEYIRHRKFQPTEYGARTLQTHVDVIPYIGSLSTTFQIQIHDSQTDGFTTT